MSQYQIYLLHKELLAIGLSILGCDESGHVNLKSPDINDLIPLALSAHGQSLSSTECKALQAVITPAQWLAYCEVRDAPARQAREVKYREMADALLFKAIESAAQVVEGKEVTLVFDKADLDTWKATKEAIRVELSYATDVLIGR